MTINNFVEKSQQELSSFLSFWTSMSKTEPEFYPFDMEEGDWLEHFAAYMDERTLDQETEQDL